MDGGYFRRKIWKAMQKIIYSKDAAAELDALCRESGADRVFVLADETTERLCAPLLEGCPALRGARHIVTGTTDTHKTLDTLAQVWRELSDGKASRRSLLVNLGGGMVTDLGGFAAATFKRGIRFANVPTTLLAMVDAAVGGKTGINFNGLKNEVGVFREADAVVVDTAFLRSLDGENLRSGYAEMLKHSLLEDSVMWAEHLRFDLARPDYAVLQELVGQSIRCKERIVAQDPHERGLRKALNLGHTVGHALESLALEQDRPVLHGYAVAYGLVCELYLSAAHTGFPAERMRQTVRFVRDNYGTPALSCDDYPHVYDIMLHDKKNVGGVINFTLLGDIGDIRLDCHLPREAVYESLDFLREG